MDTIGLIAAMPSESKALLRQIRDWKRLYEGPLRGFRFHRASWDCILITSGMGVQRAAIAAEALIEASHPVCLVSFGIAGAVRADLEIGDVIMATANYTLEKGILGPLQRMGSLTPIGQEVVRQALAPRQARLLQGTAVTTQGSQLILQPHQELINPILEMETAGILQVTRKNKTPLIVLRSISDGPTAPIPFDLGTVMDDVCNIKIACLIRAVLSHPRLLLNSGQMVRNSQIAAHNAALAIMTILDQPESIYSL